MSGSEVHPRCLAFESSYLLRSTYGSVPSLPTMLVSVPVSGRIPALFVPASRAASGTTATSRVPEATSCGSLRVVSTKVDGLAVFMRASIRASGAAS